MIVIPAIDIIQGRVVRLQQGDFTKERSYSDDPVEVALNWQAKGAGFLHIVDLDGAREGKIKNGDTISRIIKSVRIPCEVGGGLRTVEDVEYFLKEGAERVILGTSAIGNMDFLKKLVFRFGGKIVVSIDFKEGRVVKRGWLEKTGLTPVDAIEQVRKAGVGIIVVTDIATDGVLRGPNIEILRKILAVTDISVVASGGISGLGDVKKLKGIGAKNLKAIIVGRALYEGKIDLEEAIEAAK